jgi:DNA mismatch endonuclease (patch repair protein)
MDVHTKIVRSFNMSRIKGRNTKPEMMVRSLLHFNGFRYRLHDKTLLGKPDIVLKKYNSVIFINGCFWHAHPNCKFFIIPKTRREWWKTKLLNNRKRDIKATDLLKEQGWNVITIWECEIKRDLRKCGENLIKQLLRFKKA